jgi:hypothetical protein
VKNWRLDRVTLKATGPDLDTPITLFDSAVNKLFTETDDTLIRDTIRPPAPPAPPPRPTRAEELLTFEERCCVNQLVIHLNANKWHYNNAIWMLSDSNELASLLDNYPYQNSTKLLDVIENRPLAVLGNYVAFPIKTPEQFKPHNGDAKELRSIRYAVLPSRGVFAEAQLSHCNCCEERDITRFWDWSQSPCPEKAPEITGVSPGSRAVQSNLQPTNLPNSIVNIVNPPSAPDPTGLAAALNVLGTPNIFRDMSAAQEVGALLRQLAEGTISMEQARRQSQDLRNRGGINTSSSGDRQSLPVTSKAVNASAGEGFRNSSPSNTYDQLKNIESAVNSGLISNQAAARASENLLGAPSSNGVERVGGSSAQVSDSVYWADLLRFRVPSSMASELRIRGMQVQSFEDAIGSALNLDFYPVNVITMPTIDGRLLDAVGLLRYIRLHLNEVISTGYSTFSPYDRETDGRIWQSDNPTGAVIKIDLAGPDNAAVVTSLADPQKWIFSTITTRFFATGGHPVSGNREFGFKADQHGRYMFYTRGADRTAGVPESIIFPIAFSLGGGLWRSLQDGIVNLVRSHGGRADTLEPYSRRHDWGLVRNYLGLENPSTST